MRKVLFTTCLCALIAGCPGANIDLEDLLEDLQINIDRSVNVIQQRDPRTVVLPPALQQDIVLNANVDVIVDVRTDIVAARLPDITLLGFENLTGFDIYIQYLADGQIQGIFVFDGETLLLEYPCLDEIVLLFEEDFDPFTGVFVADFDLIGSEFFNPIDFECGDALILTFFPDAVEANVELISVF